VRVVLALFSSFTLAAIVTDHQSIFDHDGSQNDQVDAIGGFQEDAKKDGKCEGHIAKMDGEEVSVMQADCDAEHAVRCCASPAICMSGGEVGLECFEGSATLSEAEEFCKLLNAKLCEPAEFAHCRNDTCGSAQKSAWVLVAREETVDNSAETLPVATTTAAATTTASPTDAATTTAAPTPAATTSAAATTTPPSHRPTSVAAPSATSEAEERMWPTTAPPTAASSMWHAPSEAPRNLCAGRRATYVVDFQGLWTHYDHGDPKDLTTREYDKAIMHDSHKLLNAAHWSPIVILAHPKEDAGLYKVGKVVSAGVKEMLKEKGLPTDILETERHVGTDEKTDPHATRLFIGSAVVGKEHPLDFKERDPASPSASHLQTQNSVSIGSDREVHVFDIVDNGQMVSRTYVGDEKHLEHIIDHSLYSHNARQTAEVVLDLHTACLSVMTKAQPSPDWFTGLADYCMCNGDHWHEETIRVEAHLYDAGTDDGETFFTSDITEDGKEHPVTQIDCKNRPADTHENFCLPNGPDKLAPVGRWIITLKSIDAISENIAGSLSVSLAIAIAFLSILVRH